MSELKVTLSVKVKNVFNCLPKKTIIPFGLQNLLNDKFHFAPVTLLLLVTVGRLSE